MSEAGSGRGQGANKKAARGAERSGSFQFRLYLRKRGLIAERLPIGHFLGHIQEQFAIFLVGFAQQAT
jgi:hypothetical protein